MTMKLRPVSAAVVLLLSSMSLAYADDIRRPYIIQLTDKPVASYTGEVAGMPATKPAAGQRLNTDSGDAQLYSQYLVQKQGTVQAAVPSAPIMYNYSVVLNGFAAMLTDAEVTLLRSRSDVSSIEADIPRQLLTTYTPAFLGLDKADGLWNKLGGKSNAGEDVIIGVVDNGIWPENPAFADRVDSNGVPTFDASGTLAYSAPPASWKGICQTGDGFTIANCNRKLIGARYYDTTYLLQHKTTDWTEFQSPRDSLGNAGWGGHGTHTASTAAGNSGVTARLSGVAVGTVSGMAPRARVAMYKVCWSYEDPAGTKNSCFGGDSAAAIEQAVKDGVNVINFSIGGGGTLTDPVSEAFRNAANSGVFVAAAAGNSGPGASVSHISPWLTTVAASTHNRVIHSELTLGNGAVYTGASLNNVALPATPMIRSVDAGVAGASTAPDSPLDRCYAASSNGGVAVLDPAKVAGKIVLCTRGVIARLEKGQAVAAAGGAGMVLINSATDTGLYADPQAIPAVHVSAADGALISAYAVTANPTGALSRFTVSAGSVAAPVVASFSSRGPNAFDQNILKPDVAAPGVDVVAGHSPNMTAAQRADIINGTLVPQGDWLSLDGTSMASPHIAGLAALLHQQHPGWSPAAIKSAMMTTGTNTFPDAIVSGDTRGTLPFGQGAGQVNPNGASDPGLLYDATETDFKKYMCGAGVAAQCTAGTMLGYNLNTPSIAISNVLGTTVVNRAVTNVGATTATYTGTAAVSGYNAVVSPAQLTIEPGQTKPFTVTVTRLTGAGARPDNAWQYGALTWTETGGSRVVRSPIVARSGKAISAPGLVKSDRVSGTKMVSITTGYNGAIATNYGGLKEISRTALTVNQAAANTIEDTAQLRAACLASAPGVTVVPVTIPVGTLVAQFELFDRDTSSGDGHDDLDLLLLNSAGTAVAGSLHGGSNESMILPSPASGNYRVCIGGYASADGQSTNFTLSSAVVTAADRNGNFKVMVPARVYAGSTASVGVSWSGLPTGKRFAGAMQLYNPATGVLGSTTVFQVETNNPVPLGEPAERTPKLDSAR